MTINAARKERLNQGLNTLGSWCSSRAMGDHDTETTLTMLARKVGELTDAVNRAGWAVAPLEAMENQKREMDRHELGSPLWDRAYQLWKSAHQQWISQHKSQNQ